jgi:Tol biopolymer transport system component
VALLILAFVASACGAAAPRTNRPLRRNGEILFSKNGRLYLMRPDGTQQRRIPGSPRDVTDASFSANGRRIAFARQLGGPCPTRLYLMRADGTHVRPFSGLVSDPMNEAQCFAGLDWSPDGRWLAFSEDVNLGLSSIFVRKVDGAPPHELAGQSIEHADNDPAWSTDGKTIAFARDYGGSLWLMDADGSSKRRLDTASPPCSGAKEPDWSPDGKWIAFVEACKPPAGGGKESWSDIWLIRPDGSDLRRLTHADRQARANLSPAWSPDGKRIVFERLRGADSSDIYVMNADGKGQKLLAGSATDPDWGAR